MSKEILERDVVKYLRLKVESAGGHMRKVRWEGRRSAPDWLIMLEENEDEDYRNPISFFVETKAAGGVPRPEQAREFALMRECGLAVYVVSSFADVDALPL